MKEYNFTGKAVGWIEEGPLRRMIVRCHERDDCRLVITFGASQQKLIQLELEKCDVEEIPAL